MRESTEAFGVAWMSPALGPWIFVEGGWTWIFRIGSSQMVSTPDPSAKVAGDGSVGIDELCVAMVNGYAVDRTPTQTT